MHCKIRHFTESKHSMITRVFQQNRRGAVIAGGELDRRGAILRRSITADANQFLRRLLGPVRVFAY